MKIANNSVKYEVFFKQYLCAILDVSEKYFRENLRPLFKVCFTCLVFCVFYQAKMACEITPYCTLL